MNAIQKMRGQYLGTRIEHKWWRLYTKGGFIARGIGEYWIKDGSLFFQHRARQKPICLPLQDIAEIALCPYTRQTRGSWKTKVNLTWEKDGRWLSSSFNLPGSVDATNDLLANLRRGG